MKTARFDTTINSDEEVSAVVEIFPAEPLNNYPRPYIGEITLKDAEGNEVDIGELSDVDLDTIEEKALKEVE